jgi:DNA repair protein RecO (recombination protein O)
MIRASARMYKTAVAACGKFVLQLRQMPRCDKDFRFACARLGIEGCRSELEGTDRFGAGRRAGTLMPVHESEAIILQSYPLGEADRLVSFFSRSMGRVRGVASGARRTKSRFGSTLERLSHVHIWFYEKQNRELVRINQCDLVESFLDAFRDYGSGVALAILSEVTETVLPDHEPSDANFRLLLLTAQTIKKTGKSELPLAYFVLWTVKLGGWLPTLDACARCGRRLDSKEAAYFSPSASAISCNKCRKPGMRTLSPAVLAAARKMMVERLDRLNEEMISPRAARDLSDVMLDIIEHQIDRKLKSRELLESLA